MDFVKIDDNLYFNMALVREIRRTKYESCCLNLTMIDGKIRTIPVENCSQELQEWLREHKLEDLLDTE